MLQILYTLTRNQHQILKYHVDSDSSWVWVEESNFPVAEPVILTSDNTKKLHIITVQFQRKLEYKHFQLKKIFCLLESYATPTNKSSELASHVNWFSKGYVTGYTYMAF
jgi:predicted DNA-binding protein YlxM (UPF0122 family)